jgi:hypothetical protein
VVRLGEHHVEVDESDSGLFEQSKYPRCEGSPKDEKRAYAEDGR